MDAPGGDPTDETIGELVGRLVEDGRGYAEAEIALYKAIAEYRARRAGKALAALVAGWFLIATATTTLVIGAVLSLAAAIGPMWAGLAVGIPLLLGGGLLVRYSLAGIKGLARDKGEREAIERGASAP